MPVQTSLLDDIVAIRRMCRTQWKLHPSETFTTTPEIYGTVTGFFNKALDLRATKDPDVTAKNRIQRCWVAELFIGRRVSSFKLLTHWECQVLLGELRAEDPDGHYKLSQHGIDLIQFAGSYLEEHPDLLFDEIEETHDEYRPERTPQAAEADAVASASHPHRWPALPDLW